MMAPSQIPAAVHVSAVVAPRPASTGVVTPARTRTEHPDNEYFGNLVDAVTRAPAARRGPGSVDQRAWRRGRAGSHAAPHHPPGRRARHRGRTAGHQPVTGPLTFKPIPPKFDTVIVPNGYGQSVVLAG